MFLPPLADTYIPPPLLTVTCEIYTKNTPPARLSPLQMLLCESPALKIFLPPPHISPTIEQFLGAYSQKSSHALSLTFFHTDRPTLIIIMISASGDIDNLR